MDMNTISNNTFYQRYEDEPEVRLEVKDMPELCIHVWDGYFEDIFSEPRPSANGWTGFTRDYQEFVGAWGDDSCAEIADLSEYLKDLRAYSRKPFRYEESRDVLALLIEFLEWARNNGQAVIVSVL